MLPDELLGLKRVTRASADPSTTLASLPEAHLAVLSLRADLDVLVRQRAYHAFLDRLAVRDSCKDLLDFLSTPLPQQPPNPLEGLSLRQILCVQFHRDCHSDELASQAYRIFLDELDDDIALLPLELALRHYSMRWDGGEREDEDELTLGLEERGSTVSKSGKEVFALEQERVLGFSSQDKGTNSSGTVFIFRLSQVDLGPFISLRDLEVRLVLEKLTEPAGERLKKALEGWLKEASEPAAVVTNKESVKIGEVDNDAHFAQASATLTPQKDLDAEDTPATTATSLPSPSPVTDKASEERPKKRIKREHLDEQAGRFNEPWQFLGDRSVLVTWHPGLYTRQFALLRAIAPRAVDDLLDPPSFTTEELALLSLAANPKTLRTLPFHPEIVPQRYKHKWEERLALERIYQERGRINIDQTRLVLLTSAYPSLRLYAQVLSKVVTARDMLTKAYDTVLQARLYPRLKDKTTHDPIERIIVLVERLRDEPHYCNTMFSTSSLTLSNVSPLTVDDIGTGPLRRFEAELKVIVEYEKQAVQIAREKVKEARAAKEEQR